MFGIPVIYCIDGEEDLKAWGVLGLLALVCVILLTISTNSCIEQNKIEKDLKAHCESVGGTLGGTKCYKDGKEI